MASGRIPDEGVARDAWLHVRVTPDDLKAVDRKRGQSSRSAYVRHLIRTHTEEHP